MLYPVPRRGETQKGQETPGAGRSIRTASGAPVCIPESDTAALAGGADRLLVDGEIPDLGGGLRFTVVATPGHSPGIACLYAPARRLPIVADAVQGYGPPGAGLLLYFQSGCHYRASLERLAALDVDVLVLGRPFAWSGPAGLFPAGRMCGAFRSRAKWRRGRWRRP